MRDAGRYHAWASYCLAGLSALLLFPYYQTGAACTYLVFLDQGQSDQGVCLYCLQQISYCYLGWISPAYTVSHGICHLQSKCNMFFVTWLIFSKISVSAHFYIYL